MTNWPFLIDVTSRPISSTMPQYSWPMGVGSVVGFAPRYGHRSDPQIHVTDSLTIASVGSMMVGAGRSSKRTSRGPYRTAPRMITPSPVAASHRVSRLLVQARRLAHDVGFVPLLCPVCSVAFLE